MDFKNSDELKGFMNRTNSFKSIASASSNLTLVFPVICSRSINIDNAAMTTKAIERKCVTMLQMLFSALCITDSNNLMDHLSRFHTNLKMNQNFTVDDFIEIVDKAALSENSGIEIIDREAYMAIKEDMKNLNYFLPDSINETSINQYKVRGQSQYGPKVVIERAGDSPYDTAKTQYDMMKTRNEVFKNQIMDTDIKKANELIPTMMIVNFVARSDMGNTTIDNAVVGVKAKLYPVDSMDIINRIKLKNQDNNGFNTFIRATTREISFWRDFVFAVDKAKLDAISQSNRGSSSKMWKVLERRGVKSRVRRALGQTNDGTAITTLLISQEEVEYLKKTENINIEKPETIRPIMESYNLMGVCVVDESVEVDKFIFDSGDDMYETVSFSHLERESSDASYKKVVNLISKIR
jgi:hypothetical protein